MLNLTFSLEFILNAVVTTTLSKRINRNACLCIPLLVHRFCSMLSENTSIAMSMFFILLFGCCYLETILGFLSNSKCFSKAPRFPGCYQHCSLSYTVATWQIIWLSTHLFQFEHPSSISKTGKTVKICSDIYFIYITF